MVTRRAAFWVSLLILLSCGIVRAKSRVDSVKLASHMRKPSAEQIAVNDSLSPLRDWLRRCSSASESAERSHMIDTVYRAEKIVPKQSNPRFSKVVGPASIICKVREDGTLYDFKVFFSSGDEDFDFCGILVLKTMGKVQKCPEDLPYQRGLIFNFSNQTAHARRSVYIAPGSLDASKFYKGVTTGSEAISLNSSIIAQVPHHPPAQVKEARLQKLLKVVEKLKEMRNEKPEYLISAECIYIKELIDAGKLDACQHQIEDLTEVIRCNSLFGLTTNSPMNNLTSLVVHITEKANLNYSQTFIQKVKDLIAATEANTDFGIRTKNSDDDSVYRGYSGPDWISYSRFKDPKLSKFARPIVDAIYRAKKDRVKANIFPNQYFMANLLQLESERNPNKPPEQFQEAIQLRNMQLKPAEVLGTVENMIEDGDLKGAEVYVESVLKNDIVTRRDSGKWSAAFAELSTIYSRQNSLDLADRLLRKAVGYREANYTDEVKLLIDAYIEKKDYTRACDFYDFMLQRTGKGFYGQWASELLIDASVRDKANRDHWYKKSEERYQNLLRSSQNDAYGYSFKESLRIGRIKCLEEAGYKREAWNLQQMKSNAAAGEAALQGLKSTSNDEDQQSPDVIKDRIRACKWLIQSSRYKEADKAMHDIASNITNRPWTYDVQYSKASVELDALCGEAFGIAELEPSLKALIEAVERDSNRGIGSTLIYSCAKRYGVLNSKLFLDEFQFLYKVKQKRSQFGTEQFYLRAWLQDMVFMAEKLGKYDDAIAYQARLVEMYRKKGDSYRYDLNRACMDLVRLKCLYGNVQEGRKEFEGLKLDWNKGDRDVVMSLAEGLCEAGQIDLAEKALKIALKYSFSLKEIDRIIDKYVAACRKANKLQNAFDLLNYFENVHAGKNYYTNYAKKKRAEIRSFDKPVKK